MGVTAAITGWRRAFLDTSVFIYFLEESPLWFSVVAPIFAAVAAGRLSAVTLGITLMEVLVVPLRRNDLPLADRYEACSGAAHTWDPVPLAFPLMRDAAEVRAHTGARTPDAIHLAAGLRAGCDAFVINNRRKPPAPLRIRAVQLAELAGN